MREYGEYELVLNAEHMPQLLDSLRVHQVSIENAPGTTEQEKEIMRDLVKRAELLNAVVEAGDKLDEAQETYTRYCNGLTMSREEAAELWIEKTGTDPFTGEDITEPTAKVIKRPL